MQIHRLGVAGRLQGDVLSNMPTYHRADTLATALEFAAEKRFLPSADAVLAPWVFFAHPESLTEKGVSDSSGL